MLSHAHRQRDVVLLGPPAQRVQQQHRLAVAASQQLLARVRHQQRVPVVNWVPQLERIHCIGSPPLKLSAQLVGSEAVLVKAVAPGHAAQGGHVAADEPATRAHDLSHIRVSLVRAAKLTGASLLLSVFKYLGLVQCGDNAALVNQRHLGRAGHPRLGRVVDGEHDGDGLVHAPRAGNGAALRRRGCREGESGWGEHIMRA